MNKLIWYFKQLFPFTYWSTYQEGDPGSDYCKTYFTIWRMWFGHVFSATTVEVKDYFPEGRGQQA